MQNITSTDRAIRLLLGVVLIAAMWFPPFGIWQILKPVAAAVLMATAAIRFCPAYALFGMSRAK